MIHSLDFFSDFIIFIGVTTLFASAHCFYVASKLENPISTFRSILPLIMLRSVFFIIKSLVILLIHHDKARDVSLGTIAQFCLMDTLDDFCSFDTILLLSINYYDAAELIRRNQSQTCRKWAVIVTMLVCYVF